MAGFEARGWRVVYMGLAPSVLFGRVYCRSSKAGAGRWVCLDGGGSRVGILGAGAVHEGVGCMHWSCLLRLIGIR